MDSRDIKILEWCGFKNIVAGDKKSGWWQSPDLLCFAWSEVNTPPPIDLNLIEKYVIPKLMPTHTVEMLFMETGMRVTIYDDFGEGTIISDRGDSITTALKEALIKLIEEESNEGT